jgi:hypothetical protein
MHKERPVALLHGYLADRDNPEKPDRLTRTGILAACELYTNDEIDKICLTTKEELSNPQAKRIKMLLANPPEEDVVVSPETVTTRDEIKTFKKLAEQNEWNNLITIANHKHIPRIEKEIKKTFKEKEVRVRSTEEILSQYPHYSNRYSNILSEMENWPEQKSLALQEKILNVPILGNLILRVAFPLSRIKVRLQTYVFRQIENNRF